MCLPLEEGTTAREGASCFVNPLTALGMVETMRMEGHSALVHTAAMVSTHAGDAEPEDVCLERFRRALPFRCDR